MKFIIGNVNWDEMDNVLVEKYGLTRTSNENLLDADLYEYNVEIKDLQTLLDLQKDCGHRLVIDENEITIYDDYME